MNQEKVSEACGGTFKTPGVIHIALKEKLIGVAESEMESIDKKVINNEVQKLLLAVLFIDNSNRIIYSGLLKILENDHLMGQDKYPRDMTTTQKLLVNYKPMAKSSGTTSDGIEFTTDRRPRNHKDKSNITCF